MNIKETYKGKLFSILGDSISTLEGYSVPEDAFFYDTLKKLQAEIYTPVDTWWGQVISHLGGTLLVNNSISGSLVCKHKRCELPTYGCSDERTSALSKNGAVPDVIMVYLGTNDWGFGLKPVPNRREYEKDLDVFSVAYDLMLKKLKENYPLAEIWCFTLSKSGYENGEEIEFYFYPGGYHMEEYCKVIKDTALAQGCKVIDLYNFVPPFDTIDGYHPNKAGMKSIARGAIEAISR
ncbi:MAG: hypothetical protein J6B45_05240 [Clostridia bacterium]|nr:hypothetical protein [Clostridia bacterium]